MVEKDLGKAKVAGRFSSDFFVLARSASILNPLMQDTVKSGSPAQNKYAKLGAINLGCFHLLCGDAVSAVAESSGACAFLKIGTVLRNNPESFTCSLDANTARLFGEEELSEGVAPARPGKAGGFAPRRMLEIRLPSSSSPGARGYRKGNFFILKRNHLLLFGWFSSNDAAFFRFSSAELIQRPCKRGVHRHGYHFLPRQYLAYLVLIMIAPSYNCPCYEGQRIQIYSWHAAARFREILCKKKNWMTVAIILSCEWLLMCVRAVGWRVGVCCQQLTVLFATCPASGFFP